MAEDITKEGVPVFIGFQCVAVSDLAAADAVQGMGEQVGLPPEECKLR